MKFRRIPSLIPRLSPRGEPGNEARDSPASSLAKISHCTRTDPLMSKCVGKGTSILAVMVTELSLPQSEEEETGVTSPDNLWISKPLNRRKWYLQPLIREPEEEGTSMDPPERKEEVSPEKEESVCLPSPQPVNRYIPAAVTFTASIIFHFSLSLPLSLSPFSFLPFFPPPFLPLPSLPPSFPPSAHLYT